MVNILKKRQRKRLTRRGMTALDTAIALGVLMVIFLSAYGIAVKACSMLYLVISTMNGSPYL
jgi:hypothetical protein